jgi:hypothetical protein
MISEETAASVVQDAVSVPFGVERLKVAEAVTEANGSVKV